MKNFLHPTKDIILGVMGLSLSILGGCVGAPEYATRELSTEEVLARTELLISPNAELLQPPMQIPRQQAQVAVQPKQMTQQSPAPVQLALQVPQNVVVESDPAKYPDKKIPDASMMHVTEQITGLPAGKVAPPLPAPALWKISENSSFRAAISLLAQRAGWSVIFCLKNPQTLEDQDYLLGSGVEESGDFKKAVTAIIESLPESAKTRASTWPENSPPLLQIYRKGEEQLCNN